MVETLKKTLSNIFFNRDTKKTAMVAAGVALVAVSSYAVAQTVGLGYAAAAPALALGLTMVQTGFAR